jgi:ammonia channel protein AmtB
VPSMKPVLKFFALTVSAARWLFAITVFAQLMTLYIYRDFQNAGSNLVAADYLHVSIISALILLFGWLGFTNRGMKLVTESRRENVASEARTTRILKVLFASGAAAIAGLMLLIIPVLFFGGPQYITPDFFAYGFYILLALCFPLVYRYLK